MKLTSQKDLFISFVLIGAIIITLSAVSFLALNRNTASVSVVIKSFEIMGWAKEGTKNLGRAEHLLFKLLDYQQDFTPIHNSMQELESQFLDLQRKITDAPLAAKERILAKEFLDRAGEFYTELKKFIPLKQQIQEYMTEYKGEKRPLYDVLTERELQHNMYVRALKKSVQEHKLKVGTLDYRECGLYIWYNSLDSFEDEDIYQILIEEVDPLHQHLHNSAASIATLLNSGDNSDAAKILTDTEESLERLSLYLSGIRMLVQERYSHLNLQFSQQLASIDAIYDQATQASITFEKHLKENSVNLAMGNLEQTTFRSKILYWLFTVSGALLTVVLAFVAISRVVRRSEDLHREIGERKLAMERIRKQREFLTTVINSLNYPFYVIDADTYRIKMANKAASLLGDTNNNYCHKLTHQQDEPCSSDEHPCPVAEIKKTGKPVVVEHIHLAHLGRPRDVEVHGHPISNNNGKVESVIEYSIDITDRKQTSRQLLRAKEAAEEANRAKSEFLANMSHEIRTPMNGIIGFTDLLLQTETSDNQHKFIDIIKVSASRLLGIINDILDFTKIDAGKLDLEVISFDISDLMHEIYELMSLKIKEKGLEYSCSIAPDVPSRLYGDPTRVRQIFYNLISNSVKFTEKGKIEVNIATGDPQQQSTAQGEGSQKMLHCTVRDTGIGIKESQQKMIFDAFTQADGSMTRQYGGTGLGLAIISRLVKLMGGTVWLESIVDTGTIFHFTIQLDVEEPREKKARKVTPGEGSAEEAEAEGVDTTLLRGQRVLLAEDEVINQILAINLLEEVGCRVTAVTNGKEAVDAFQQESFDLILMDVQMPEMDGVEATRAIRATENQSSPTPIIAVTAHAMHGDRERFLAAGMTDYVPKPISIEELLRVMSRNLPSASAPKSSQPSEN